MCECITCNGNGIIELYIGIEHADTITCPDCNGVGKVSREVNKQLIDCDTAYRAALLDESS